MNDAFSLSISVGIIAFGIWIAAGTIGAGSPLAWALMGLLPVIIGTISLSLAIREVRVRSGIEILKYRQLTRQAHLGRASVP